MIRLGSSWSHACIQLRYIRSEGNKRLVAAHWATVHHAIHTGTAPLIRFISVHHLHTRLHHLSTLFHLRSTIVFYHSNALIHRHILMLFHQYLTLLIYIRCCGPISLGALGIVVDSHRAHGTNSNQCDGDSNHDGDCCFTHWAVLHLSKWI